MKTAQKRPKSAHPARRRATRLGKHGDAIPVLCVPVSLKDAIALQGEIRERIAAQIPEVTQARVKLADHNRAIGVQAQVGGRRVAVKIDARVSYSRNRWIGRVIAQLRVAAQQRGIET